MTTKHSILDFRFQISDLLKRIPKVQECDLPLRQAQCQGELRRLLLKKRTEPWTERRNRSLIALLQPVPKNSTAAKIRTIRCL